MKKIILKIDGMRCSMCESHINDLVRKNSNAKKVSSSHIKKTTKILMDEVENIDKIKNAIENDGYKVLDVSIEDYQKESFFKKLFKK